MVATRRTAPTAADTEMPDPELALKKKPVRKTAAKASAAKTEAKAPAKSTRGKKAAEPESEPEPVEEAPKPKSTRGRPKKTVEVAREPEREPEPEAEQPTKPAKATRATRTGSVRSKKTPVAVEDTPDLPAPKEAKPARQTRAAASKAAPLSPKKITQVTKPATRNAKAVDSKKPAAKGATGKGSVRSRGATRGRAVSDENADVPELAQPLEEDDSVVVVSSTPVKKKPVTRRQAAKKQEIEESEISMSTRETTPTASPARSQNDEVGSQVDEPSADLSTPDKQDQTTHDNDSDDELCGPKTPMRRGSPGAEARYQESAQRTIRKYNEEQRMQTPARRYAVLGSQKGTPQTQKPSRKPSVPSSEVRPLTVARGAERAFVFKDLRDGAPKLPRRQQQQQQEHETIAEEEDVSFIPDDNILAMDEDEGLQLTTPSGPAPLQLASPPTSSTDVDDEDVQVDLAAEQIETEDFGAPASESGDDDADVTIITEKQDDETELDESAQPKDVESFETDDTVIVGHPEQGEEADVTMSAVDDSEDSVIHHESASSQTPETMVWENVHPEQTITVNFDEHLSESRSLPQPEPTEVLDIASRLDSHLEQENQAVAGAEEVSDEELEEVSPDEEPESLLQQETPIETPNVDLNDYFDMNALAEPTQVVDFAQQPAGGAEVDMVDAPAAVEPGVSSDDEIEATVIHNEPAVEVHAEPAIENEAGPVEKPQKAELIDPFSEDEDSAVEEEDQDVAAPENGEQPGIPHYAQSTFASRRKSLPATSMSTPVRINTRPNTSDGASIARLANPFAHAWWARPEATSTATTPQKSRPSTAYGAAVALAVNSPSKPTTPAASERYPVLAPRRNQVDHSQTAVPARFRYVEEKPATRRQTFHRAISGRKQEAPTPVKPATPVQKPKERYPLLGSQPHAVDHSQTVAPPKRFQDAEAKPANRRKTFHKAASGKTQTTSAPSEPATPVTAATPVATPKERYPALGSRPNYADHAKTAAPPARFQDPANKPATRRQTFHRAISGKAADKENDASTPAAQSPVVEEVATTPQPQQTPTERFPRLRPQSTYQDHAQTVAAPRFHIPVKQSPVKRPATTQKPSSMRKAALRNSASTPMKTPLKAPAMTPGQEPMTPHPAAPLRGVVALVEVYTLEGASASAPFTALLLRLGAKTTRSWNERVTHVIFKDGSPTTLQRVRLHNKGVASAEDKGNHIFCVNSRWVSDCDTSGAREDESDEAYAVDVEEVPRGGKRRRKSMEPSALMNLGGNIVRDRKSSLGRASLGRSSGRVSEASPAKKAKLAAQEIEDDVIAGAPVEEKENSTAEEEDDEEPATPAWIARPDKLVQQTAPMKRVKKLEMGAKQSRRLTFWDGRN